MYWMSFFWVPDSVHAPFLAAQAQAKRDMEQMAEKSSAEFARAQRIAGAKASAERAAAVAQAAAVPIETFRRILKRSCARHRSNQAGKSLRYVFILLWK